MKYQCTYSPETNAAKVNLAEFFVCIIIKRVLSFWIFLVIFILDSWLLLMQKRERSVPCDTDLSATNHKALIKL